MGLGDQELLDIDTHAMNSAFLQADLDGSACEFSERDGDSVGVQTDEEIEKLQLVNLVRRKLQNCKFHSK